MDFLNNTNIVVAIGFVIFVGILIYFGVPGMLTRELDARAVRIKAELDEARALRDEAQTLLAGYERRQKEVKAQAEDIVTAARAEAEKAAEAAKEDIRNSVARRLQTATEQIAAAEQGAIRQIKDQAVTVAVAAAGDVLREQDEGRRRQPADRRGDLGGRRQAALARCTGRCGCHARGHGVPCERKPMKTIEARKQELETRLGELKARIARIEDELEQPLSDSFSEQAVEREDDEVLEDLGAAGVQEVRMIEAALDRDRQRHLRHLRPLRRPDRRGAARRAAADAALPGLRRHRRLSAVS